VALIDVRMPGLDGLDRVHVVVFAYESGLVKPGDRPG
jgi:hypothetical protein